jgi:hypothetical protein
MGCGDECPLVRARLRVDWKIPDPRDMTPDEFREVRNLIEAKVKELLETISHNIGPTVAKTRHYSDDVHQPNVPRRIPPGRESLPA